MLIFCHFNRQSCHSERTWGIPLPNSSSRPWVNRRGRIHTLSFLPRGKAGRT